MRATVGIALVTATALAACGGEPGTVAAPGTTPTISGTYRVPVSADLASAAVYSVPEVTWTVSAGTATLAYALPRELVGKTVRVSFAGPFDAATGRGTLTGPAGTAECATSGTTVTCTETMRGLLPLDPDLGVVEKLAPAGMAAARVEVAKRFSTDPIGIADFAPAPSAPVDDHKAKP